MKTYAFHSHKGGSGRTLALSNFALFLTRKGHNVVMIDLDFDAPGLPYKFRVQDKVRGGYVSYLMGVNRSARANGTDKATRIEYIQDYLIRIDDRLSLLPAGDPGRMAYWQHLASEEFHRIFSPEFSSKGPRAQRGPAISQENWLAFKQDLEDICTAAGNPEYCLVDCRAARDSVAVPLLLWADHIVEFLHCNREGVFGALLLRKMLATSELRTKDYKFTPVVARVPYGTSIDRIKREFSLFVEEFSESPIIKDMSLPLDQLKMIVEQRNLEIGDTLVLREQERSSYSISFSYMDLFDDLTSTQEASADEKKQSFIEQGLNPSNEIIERYFEYRFSLGELANKDGQRNVALRNETLTALMNSLATDQAIVLTKNGIPEEKIGPEIASGMERAGFRAGETFGKEAISVPKVWNNSTIPKTTLERLQQWCGFDGTAGFGNWTPRYDPETRLGEIVFENQILKEANWGIGPAFLRGYIIGVLGYLVGDIGTVARIKILDSDPPTPTKIEFVYEGENSDGI